MVRNKLKALFYSYFLIKHMFWMFVRIDFYKYPIRVCFWNIKHNVFFLKLSHSLIHRHLLNDDFAPVKL